MAPNSALDDLIGNEANVFLESYKEASSNIDQALELAIRVLYQQFDEETVDVNQAIEVAKLIVQENKRLENKK